MSSEDYVQGPPDNSGKKLRSLLAAIGGNNVEMLVHLLADPTTPTNLLKINADGSINVGGFALPAEPANEIYAGPTSGSPALPTFRPLVIADLPAGIPPANIAPGTNSQVLTTVAGITAWAAAGGAGIGTGPTLPPTPSTGQAFMHTPTGRQILYEWNGSAWYPIISYGTMTIYVDGTYGTDDLNHGYGTTTSAFETITFACAMIPPIFNGNVMINVSAATYTENPILSCKIPGGAFTITLSGTLTTVASATASGGSQGATQGVLPTVTVSGTPWVANAYKNMLIIFSPTTTTVALQSFVAVIDANTNNTLTLVGWMPGVPVSTDTFSIYTWGTILNGELTAGPSQPGVAVQYFNINNTTISIYTTAWSLIVVYCCWLVTTAANAHAFLMTAYSTGNIITCILDSSVGLGHTHDVYASSMLISNSKFFGGAFVGFDTQDSFIYYLDCIYDGNAKASTYGLYIAQHGIAAFAPNGATSKAIIRNCVTGLYVLQFGMTVNYGIITFTNNTTNDTVVSASYGLLA